MNELDETDLMEFFGVAPEPQDSEEAEFFGTVAFAKRVGELEIEFSLHRSHRDVSMGVRRLKDDEYVVTYELLDYESARVEPDKSGRSWLRIRSSRGDELGIAVAPGITVRLTGSQAGT